MVQPAFSSAGIARTRLLAKLAGEEQLDLPDKLVFVVCEKMISAWNLRLA